MDEIRLWREDHKPRCSIPTPIRHHSPDGIEWGYGGSGPADLALNILHHFIGLPDSDVDLWDGSSCAALTERLHERFKRDIIAHIPEQGATLPMPYIEGWIKGATEKLDG